MNKIGPVVAILLLLAGFSSCRMFNHSEEDQVPEEQLARERREHVADSLAWLLCGHLYAAEEAASLDTVKLWLGQGANPNLIYRYDGSTQRRISKVPVANRYVRSTHSDVQYQATALGIAVRHQRLDIVDALLAAGADLNFLDDYTPTALEEAYLYGDEALVRELMRRGAELRTLREGEIPYGQDKRLFRKLQREQAAEDARQADSLQH